MSKCFVYLFSPCLANRVSSKVPSQAMTSEKLFDCHWGPCQEAVSERRLQTQSKCDPTSCTICRVADHPI